MKRTDFAREQISRLNTALRRTRLASVIALMMTLGIGVSAQEAEVLNPVLDIDSLYTELSSQEIYGRTAAELLAELQDKHYSRVMFDDLFSQKVFDGFIDALDSSRLYFLQSDIDTLTAYRNILDDTLKSGTIDPAFEIYNLYHRRLLERLVYAINHVENDLASIDFTLDESIELDREEAPFATTTAELDELWRQRVKNSALSLKLAKMDLDKIEERLSKRYRAQLNQVLKTNDRDVFQSYLATVASTIDPHTSYFSPRDSENFNMNLRLSLQGIGAQLTSEDEYTKVVELIKGGPAERGKELKAGDRIIGIAQGPDGEMKDVIGLRLDDVVDQIRGEKGTLVRLNVIPAEATGETQAHEVAITRDTVKLEDQSAKKEVIEVSYNEGTYKVGVIKLPTFYFDFEAASAGQPDFKSSTRDVKALLEELKAEGVDAVVMDLRDNGGGSLTEANDLVGLFIETGNTVQIRYSGLRNGFVRAYGDGNPEVTYDGPLGVLVNRASASASEIFAGAIQDYQRGIILGGQTFGKGTVQEIIPMNYGQVKLTRSKFYRISGASTQHRGVLPDITFPDRYQAIEKMGESNLDGALPWDTVRPVEYNTYFPIKDILPNLQSMHQERVISDPDFIYLSDQIERTREMREQTTLSLNEERVKSERDANRLAEFNANNMRLFLKGLPLAVWTEPTNEELDPEANTVASVTEDEVDAEDVTEEDPLLVESSYILIDMAQMLGTPMTADVGGLNTATR
ncbi:MAG: carboxy terminal-processing peptidase [Gammaproteobacteria bacterium]|nr:carboxy terminal-processing peptidase [Gammaproteobacteria bacterium]MDP2141170.1 carboxy terminal-processing peptidase [Gammaproteobacteria bacterium]MDP2349156.1 carboxy terminal-processing peptidase [Gammaproteobacteria bacterium]